MATEKMVRVSVTLPPALVADLDYISARVKVPRSSLLAELMEQPVHDMRLLVESVPPNPTMDDLERARGRTADLIDERISQFKALESDLFAPKRDAQ